MQNPTRASLVAALAGALVALASAASLVGHPAHLVHALGLFGGGFGAGAGVTSAIAQARRTPPPPPGAGKGDAPTQEIPPPGANHAP